MGYLDVQGIKVLGLELVQAMPTYARNDPVLQAWPIHRFDRRLAGRSRCDVREPSPDPLGHSRKPPGIGDRPFGALALQLFDLLGGLRSCLAPPMAPVRLAVGLHADRHPAMPHTIIVLVDRGSTVCVSRHRNTPYAAVDSSFAT